MGAMSAKGAKGSDINNKSWYFKLENWFKCFTMKASIVDIEGLSYYNETYNVKNKT